MKRTLQALLAFASVITGLTACGRNEPESVGVEGVFFYAPEETYDFTPITPEDYEDEFNLVLDTIDRWYALKERKGVTREALEGAYRHRVEEAENRENLIEVFTEMFAALDNGHARLFEYRQTHLASAVEIEDRYFLEDMSESSTLHGFAEPGWEIVSIDDVPVTTWIQAQEHFFGGTDQWVRRQTTHHVFMRFPFQREERTYGLLDPEGEEHIITLDLEHSFKTYLEFSNPDAPVSARTLEIEGRDVGYISITEMSGSSLEHFDRSLEGIQNTDGLILDLRWNSGGSSSIGDQLFRRLIDEPTPGWVTVADEGPPHPPHEEIYYGGSMVVLVGHRTFSAAESFAFDLHDAERAVFAGETTGGCSGGGPRSFITGSGLGFSFPTRGVDRSVLGTEMEGTGLIPKHEVHQTLADYRNGTDTVLEEGLTRLKALLE